MNKNILCSVHVVARGNTCPVVVILDILQILKSTGNMRLLALTAATMSILTVVLTMVSATAATVLRETLLLRLLLTDLSSNSLGSSNLSSIGVGKLSSLSSKNDIQFTLELSNDILSAQGLEITAHSLQILLDDASELGKRAEFLTALFQHTHASGAERSLIATEERHSSTLLIPAGDPDQSTDVVCFIDDATVIASATATFSAKSGELACLESLASKLICALLIAPELEEYTSGRVNKTLLHTRAFDSEVELQELGHSIEQLTVGVETKHATGRHDSEDGLFGFLSELLGEGSIGELLEGGNVGVIGDAAVESLKHLHGEVTGVICGHGGVGTVVTSMEDMFGELDELIAVLRGDARDEGETFKHITSKGVGDILDCLHDGELTVSDGGRVAEVETTGSGDLLDDGLVIVDHLLGGGVIEAVEVDSQAVRASGVTDFEEIILIFRDGEDGSRNVGTVGVGFRECDLSPCTGGNEGSITTSSEDLGVHLGVGGGEETRLDVVLVGELTEIPHTMKTSVTKREEMRMENENTQYQ